MKSVKKYTCILISLLFLSGILQNAGIQGNIIGFMTQEVQAAETLQETSTGWKRTAGERYYYQNGYPVKGFRKIANDCYYFDSKGRMKTGWQYIRNRYRYFDSKTGKMKKNATVQGRKINADGVWIPVIVLDPGHSSRMPGGYEPLGPGSSEQKAKDNYGAEGCVTKVNEYELNLTIARKLQTELKKQGCKVILTRRNNKTAISCAQRAKIANKAKADVYLRIHANDVDSSSNTGAMTICVSSHNRFVSSKMIGKSYALSKTICIELTNH